MFAFSGLRQPRFVFRGCPGSTSLAHRTQHLSGHNWLCSLARTWDRATNPTNLSNAKARAKSERSGRIKHYVLAPMVRQNSCRRCLSRANRLLCSRLFRRRHANSPVKSPLALVLRQDPSQMRQPFLLIFVWKWPSVYQIQSQLYQPHCQAVVAALTAVKGNRLVRLSA